MATAPLKNVPREMLAIDGSEGEGGGQVLRTALALSLVTGTPFSLHSIRGRRPRPGLMRQHLACVLAARAVGSADATGAALGSSRLEFRPGQVSPGEYHFQVGSAGSACLVLQTVLPALLTATGPSNLVLDGGTHNPMAPPFDFLDRCFAPLVRRLGPRLDLGLVAPGFHPAGGGRFTALVHPVPQHQLKPLELNERGPIRRREARAWVSQLPAAVGERELSAVRSELGWSAAECRVVPVERPVGPGSALVLEVEAEHVTGVFTAFGDGRRPAQDCAREAAAGARDWVQAGVAVEEHLADQLLLLLALAGGGSFTTTRPSLHATTNADVIRKFLDVRVDFEQCSELAWQVRVLQGR